MPTTHPPTSQTLAKPENLQRDPQADFPGVNTARNKSEAPLGSAAAATGVGHPKHSKTEAQRGTSG